MAIYRRRREICDGLKDSNCWWSRWQHASMRSKCPGLAQEPCSYCPCLSEKIMLLCCVYRVMREGSVHDIAWGSMPCAGIH